MPAGPVSQAGRVNGSVPAPYASWDQVLDVQGKMNATAAALKSSPGQGAKGSFVDVTAGPDDRQVVLYWHGDLTPAAEAVIAASAVPVVVKPAGHTAPDLKRAADRVAEAAESAKIRMVDVTQVQGGGLRASIEGGAAEAARLRTAVAAVGVPVEVVPGAEPQVALGDRKNGQYAGGAALATPICSTGFAVVYQGQEMMMTADHCFPTWAETNERFGLDERLGVDSFNLFGDLASPKDTVRESTTRVDVATIRPRSNKWVNPEIWTGKSYNDPSGQAVASVIGAEAPQIGNFVCQSGARSGTKCNLKVVSSQLYYWTGENSGGVQTRYNHGMVAELMTPGTQVWAAMRGDSGGPVVFGTEDQVRLGTKVHAAGIVSASHGGVRPCPSGPHAGQNICTNAFTFVPIDRALNYLDAGILYDGFNEMGLPEELTKKFTELPPRDPFGNPPAKDELKKRELHDVHNEIASANGTVIGFATAMGGFFGTHSGSDARSRWIARQATDGGWYFVNVADPYNAMGVSVDVGLQIVELTAGWFQIRMPDGNCVHLEPDAPDVGEVIAAVLSRPCDSGDIDQWMHLVASSSDLSVSIPTDSAWYKPPVGGSPATARLAVMPLGDSITLGVGSTTRTGYRPGLAGRLAGAAGSVEFVGSQSDTDGTRHEGHSGWRIDQIQADIETWLAAAKPNVVTLHIGTNDMNRDYLVSTAPDRLGTLLDQIHAASPDTAIVLASLVPATDPAVQARVDAYNKAIPGLVSARTAKGHHIVQVSMGALTTADLNDDLHPNNAGYTKMAAAFHDGIQTLIRRGWVKETVVVNPAPPKRKAGIGDYNVDINGDRRADYLIVEANGATRAFLNTADATGKVKFTDNGYIATGSSSWSGNQVRFADINADQRADYLIVEANGATRAFLNTADATGKVKLTDSGYIATGSTAWSGDQVRYADINADQRADYLIVEANGATRAFVNTADATGKVKFTDNGYIATGSTSWTGDQVRYADINADQRADYLIVEANGATRAFLNTADATGKV
ncbi:GDSL-type esterase/lipase family protein, partial [Streptomyces sp. NPDC056144]|uniref:GDSL-type esterase/lipase family protein n=1 Tax=Streptomyces sp. NPDC056144 TaxID=3345726 RepID=UPI0035D8E745